MRNLLIGLASLALASAAGASSAIARDMTCWGPAWQRVTDPRLGVSVEVTADTYVGFGAIGDILTFSRSERARPGGKISGRCSSFNFAMYDLGGRTISDAEALFDVQQKSSLQGLKQAELVSSRRLTVQGYPAREFLYRFLVDPKILPPFTATHRVLLVTRDNRLYEFKSGWQDAGPAPSDSERSFNSIRFVPITPDPHMRSQALLSMTINEYWIYDQYPDRIFFTPELKAIADRKRQAESAVVKEYGYFDAPQFVRVENGWRVFRVEHENAVVEWSIRDDGRKISGLTWKKVSP